MYSICQRKEAGFPNLTAVCIRNISNQISFARFCGKVTAELTVSIALCRELQARLSPFKRWLNALSQMSRCDDLCNISAPSRDEHHQRHRTQRRCPNKS